MENDRGIIVYCSGVVFHFFVGDDDGLVLFYRRFFFVHTYLLHYYLRLLFIINLVVVVGRRQDVVVVIIIKEGLHGFWDVATNSRIQALLFPCPIVYSNSKRRSFRIDES